MMLGAWMRALRAELGRYCDPAAPLPAEGWVARQAARTLLQYPSGVSRAVLLTELEAAW
jgi:hypothetical protein